MLRSREYTVWRKEASWAIAVQSRGYHIAGPFKMTLLVVPPDKRHRDIDNLLKASLDAVAASGLIENDRHCRWIEARWVEDGAPCTIILEQIGEQHE